MTHRVGELSAAVCGAVAVAAAIYGCIGFVDTVNNDPILMSTHEMSCP